MSNELNSFENVNLTFHDVCRFPDLSGKQSFNCRVAFIYIFLSDHFQCKKSLLREPQIYEQRAKWNKRSAFVQKHQVKPLWVVFIEIRIVGFSINHVEYMMPDCIKATWSTLCFKTIGHKTTTIFILKCLNFLKQKDGIE